MCPLAKYCEKILLYNAPFRGVFYLSGNGKIYFNAANFEEFSFFPKRFELKMHMGKPEN